MTTYQFFKSIGAPLSILTFTLTAMESVQVHVILSGLQWLNVRPHWLWIQLHTSTVHFQDLGRVTEVVPKITFKFSLFLLAISATMKIPHILAFRSHDQFRKSDPAYQTWFAKCLPYGGNGSQHHHNVWGLFKVSL